METTNFITVIAGATGGAAYAQLSQTPYQYDGLYMWPTALRFLEAKQYMEGSAVVYSVRYQYSRNTPPHYSWRSEENVLFADSSVLIDNKYNGNQWEVTLKLVHTQYDDISLWIKGEDSSYTIKFQPQPSSVAKTERNFPSIFLQTNLKHVSRYDRHQMRLMLFHADVHTPGYEFKYMFWSLVTLNGSEVVLNYGSSLPNFASDNGPLRELIRTPGNRRFSDFEVNSDDLGDGALLTVQVITARVHAPSSPVAQVRATYSFVFHPESLSGPFAQGSVAVLDQPPVVCWSGTPCSIACSAYGNGPISVELFTANSDGSKGDLVTAPMDESRGDGWVDAIFRVDRAGEYICHADNEVNVTETHVHVYIL